MTQTPKGAGGTPGGVGTFLIGLGMLVAGAYLLLTKVQVTTGGFHFYGYNAFGLSLLPLLAGVAMLFFNGRSLAGWLLAGIGALIIFVGIISNLSIYLQPGSLFDTLVVLGLIAGGLGTIARALRASGAPEGAG